MKFFTSIFVTATLLVGTTTAKRELCEDSASFPFNEDSTKDCDWVFEKPIPRCAKKSANKKKKKNGFYCPSKCRSKCINSASPSVSPTSVPSSRPSSNPVSQPSTSPSSSSVVCEDVDENGTDWCMLSFQEDPNFCVSQNHTESKCNKTCGLCDPLPCRTLTVEGCKDQCKDAREICYASDTPKASCKEENRKCKDRCEAASQCVPPCQMCEDNHPFPDAWCKTNYPEGCNTRTHSHNASKCKKTCGLCDCEDTSLPGFGTPWCTSNLENNPNFCNTDTGELSDDQKKCKWTCNLCKGCN